MSVTMPWSLISAIVATVVIWTWALTRPSDDVFDLRGIFYGGVALIGTLLFWLCYLAVRVATGV